jgi:glycosyltransferase involved in cell wall biosynthesis
MESDIFVLPSRREGMPNALMEAMLLGLPCIGTDISGCQDLITNGTNGILVPPGNNERLFQALVYLMENPEAGKRMGPLARQTICTFNSMDIVCNQYLSLYNDLVNRQNN